jgi:ligand-binding sensor domain-containing protein/signal transduction histidine kinase
VASVVSSHALDPHQSLRHYGYQSWQTDSGLPQNTVHAVLQASDGYLWIGTEAGLVRFDSTQFKVFIHADDPQLPGDLIYSLLEDRSGTLWIGTSSGVARYRNGAFLPLPPSDPAQNAAVWSIHQDKAGNLWILTASGVARFDGRRFVPIPRLPVNHDSAMLDGRDGGLWLGAADGLRYAAAGSADFQPIGSAAAIQALALDFSGRTWAGTGSGIEICTAHGCTPFSPGPPDAPGQNIHSLAFDAQGTAWIGTGDGLFSWESKSGKSHQLSHWTTSDGLPSNRVSQLFFDHQGALWIAAAGGLARLGGNRIEALTPRSGFSSSIVLAMFEDREGSLWLGTETGGLDILRDRTFSTYTAADGLADDHIRAVYQDSTGVIWLGASGGLDRKDANGFTALTTANGISSNVVLSIAGGSNGDLWLGTPDGLDRIHHGQVKVFTSADGLADDFVRSLYFDPQGTLWIGTRRGLSRWKDGRFTTFTALDGLGSDLVGAILQSHDGTLWIGTLGGLTRYANGVFRNYTEKDGLSNRIITALCEDSAGALWIGTGGGGLNRLSGGRIQPVTARHADLPAGIYSILEDAEDHLWLSSSSGIVRVGRSALNRSLDGGSGTVLRPVPVDSYGAADGMKSSEASSGGHPAAWRMQDGSLWFATLKGVATVDPAHLAMNRTPPLVSVEDVSIDDAPQPSDVAVTIPAGSHRLAIEYAALSFVAPQKVRFRYRLHGFDREWVDAGARRTAYYTNLPPGNYTFEVLACNNDGLWSLQPARLALLQRPWFYQTIWFYLLLALLTALLGYAASLWRLRQVEARFQVVLGERNRIAREIHDTLAQGFVAVSVQLQVASRLLLSSPVTAQRHLAQAQEMVRTGLEDARLAIWELRSQSASGGDFAGKLSRMAERLTASTSIQAKVRVHGSYHPLPPATEDQLLRIAQEAVTNAVRHAQPANIDVQLRFSESLVELIVEDDGSGFDGPAPSLKEGHYGLTGMSERAQQLGGTVNVTSHPARGTRVSIEIPQTAARMKDNE